MGLRNRRNPAGFSRLVAPFLFRTVRCANRKALLRLEGPLGGRTARRARPSDRFRTEP